MKESTHPVMRTTIISWNVNGLRQRHRMNQFLQVFRHNPEIICIQETKSSEMNIPADLKEIYGYHSWFAPVKNGDFAEVALYSRWPPSSVKFGFGGTAFDDEGRVIVADFDQFVLLNVYFPLGVAPADTMDHKLAFYDAFLSYIMTMNKNGRRLIICGDFSIAHTDKDVFNPKKKPSRQVGVTSREREKIDQLIGLGFSDAFRLFNNQPGHYSWWPNGFTLADRRNGWRLDYFFVNEPARYLVKNSDILTHIEGSDHSPVSLEIETPDDILRNVSVDKT